MTSEETMFPERAQRHTLRRGAACRASTEGIPAAPHDGKGGPA